MEIKPVQHISGPCQWTEAESVFRETELCAFPAEMKPVPRKQTGRRWSRRAHGCQIDTTSPGAGLFAALPKTSSQSVSTRGRDPSSLNRMSSGFLANADPCIMMKTCQHFQKERESLYSKPRIVSETLFQLLYLSLTSSSLAI